MKKIIVTLLALAMVFTMTACSKADDSNDTPVDNTPVVTEKTYKLGMGVVVANSSKDEQAQTDSTVVALVVDEEGKVVKAAIDVAQNKMPMDAVDPAKEFKSKQELLFDYNMKNASPIGKEWFEQAAGYCEWLVGKTLADVKGQTTEEKNGHQVSTDADLYAACTMQVTDFFAATVKAFEDAQSKSFTTASDVKLGLGVVSTAADSTEDVIKMYSHFSAVATDAEGKALAGLIDAIQPKVDYTSGSPDFQFKATKRELKEDYNMKGASPIGKEWYEQAAGYGDWLVGKSLSDIEGQTTEEKNGHQVSTDADLYASCTMQVTDFFATTAKAFANAK